MARSPTTARSKGPGQAAKRPHEAPEPRRQATVIKLPRSVHARAFELLAAQPVSLVGLPMDDRDRIVVTAVADEHGNEHAVSRFGDQVWDMGPEVEAKNQPPSNLRISWPVDVSKALVDDAKAALYCALRRGRQGDRPWSGSSIATVGRSATPLLRHLASQGLRDFGEVRALHLSDYVADLRRKLQAGSVRNRMEIVDLVWCFRMDVVQPLPEYPWAGMTLRQSCGCNEDEGGPSGRTGKTPVIPRSVQRALFAHCEARLGEAEALFQARNAGEIKASSYELITVRNAALYLLQITSGMRNSESTGVVNGCWRTEVKNGITFHWVRTKEIKTGRGVVDFLIPPQAVRALEILQRYAQPLQARLADEARWLEQLLGDRRDRNVLLNSAMDVVKAVERLNHIREIGQHLFLCVSMHGGSDHLDTGSRVNVLSIQACNNQLKTLTRAAGSHWDLANHQCRRTFAYNVANSRLGRMGLVFVKWQLKHTSLSWTQLYASNPYQDHSLYRDMEEEQIQARVELMEGWLRPDAPLTGGAGKKLMQTRATPATNLQDLLRHTAEVIAIRSTGHAWCLSGTRGCHGQGVYDPTMCGGCSQAIIDGDQASTWQMIHLDNLRLAAITDCGPAVAQKAERAIQRSTQVLQDLGVPLPTAEQAAAYETTQARA